MLNPCNQAMPNRDAGAGAALEIKHHIASSAVSATVLPPKGSTTRTAYRATAEPNRQHI